MLSRPLENSMSLKASEIQALLDEPACTHNTKEKSGCAKPKPGATAGGCSFDGAQIALLPIADVAHIVHGPIACAGSSWDNRGTRSSGITLYKIGMTTDLSETDVVMGRGEKRLFHAIKQAIDSYSPKAVFIYNTCVTALIGDDVGAVCKAATERWGVPHRAGRCGRLLRHQESRQPAGWRGHVQARHRHGRTGARCAACRRPADLRR
jgi:nitrogenase molybdenum-cofactor synthesis protein NifE